jgi:hypothetical protein
MVMNPYALPSIIAFALLLFLGLIVLLQNPGSKTSRLLCAICLTYGLSVGSAGMLHLSVNEVQAIFWNKWPYIFGLPNLVLIMEFALHASDRPKRLKDTFIGLPVAVHRWIIYVILGASWIALLISDWILAPPRFYTPTGWEHQYGPLMPPSTVLALYMAACLIFVLLQGVKSASNAIERKARIITLVALGGARLFITLIGVMLPALFRIQTHSFTAFGWVFMCFVLAYGLLRLQRETIQDLNVGLEQKVALRTEELSLANQRLRSAQEQISKYIDPNVTEKIFKGEFTAELSHKRTKLTMFFSDIKDFTHFTDASDPEDVARLLNEYLGEMARIVRRWGGTIPQFTGDSVYAIFGAPDSRGLRDDALACMRMALEMQAGMKVLREKWWNQGIQFPFEI